MNHHEPCRMRNFELVDLVVAQAKAAQAGNLCSVTLGGRRQMRRFRDAAFVGATDHSHLHCADQDGAEDAEF